MFYRWEGANLHLSLLVRASAKVDTFGKVRGDELKVSIKKAPEQGKATKYLLDWLAESFHVSQKSVILISGALTPHKQVFISSPRSIPKSLQPLIQVPKHVDNII